MNLIEWLNKLHKSCRFYVVFNHEINFPILFAWLPPTHIFTCWGCWAQLLSSSAVTLPLLQILLEFLGINGGLKNRKRFWSQLQVIRHCIYLIPCLPTLYSLSQECHVHVQLATPKKWCSMVGSVDACACRMSSAFLVTRLGADMRTTCQLQHIRRLNGWGRMPCLLPKKMMLSNVCSL